MSGSSEDGRLDRANGSGGSNEPPTEAGPSNAGDDRPHGSGDKTISCTSCRRRKLKCDRKKPQCATCVRLRNTCEYPTRRKNTGSNKRRNMKELEARLAQVETQLVSESKGGTAPNNPDGETDWNDFRMDMTSLPDGAAVDGYNMSSYDFPAAGALDTGFLSQELMSLGVQEPLPPDDMMDELHRIYFEKIYPTMPIIHKFRYMASLSLPPHMRPPIGLRYAIWMEAACISDKYLAYEDIFYQRARKYLEAAEMKGHGETFVTVRYAQAWGLIGAYEAKKTFFSRAWMSVGRMSRLVQMLGLHNLDGGDQGPSKRILPPAKDWIELEERRRTFWAAFYADRWASSSTGWPMIIKEDEIMTNLPSSEDSYTHGIVENTISLAETLTGEGASKISSFGAVILSSCLFGHNFEHLHKKGPDERPDDLANGEFWKRHRKIDNVLSNTFMFLPDHLRMPGGARDLNVVYLHTNIHAASISLHQAAILTAERYGIDSGFISISKARSLMAAEEIANIMRLVSHRDAANMNSWMGFCLYVAGGVFIQNRRSDNPSPNSLSNLEFLLAAMRALGNRHSVTKHFTAQLELDIEGTGVMKPLRSTPNPARVQLPTVMDGLGVDNRAPMIFDRLRSFSENKSPEENPDAGNCPQQSNVSVIPLYGILPNETQTTCPKETDAPISNFNPNTAPISLETRPQQQQQQPRRKASVPHPSEDHSTFVPSNPPNTTWSMENSPFMIDNSTPSDSSSTNAMQYAYRPVIDPNIVRKPSDGYGAYQYPTGLETFNVQADWAMGQNVSEQGDGLGQDGGILHPLMDSDGWGGHQHQRPPMN